MSAPKHIVFDWNGTLLDDINALHGCTNQLLVSEGHKPITVESFRERYHIPFDRFYHSMGFDDAEVKRLMELENSAFHENYEAMVTEAGLRDGAAEILGHAQKNGIKSFILSNHIVDPIRAQVKRLNVEHLFAEILAYADRATQFRDMTKGERLRRFMKQKNMIGHETIIVGDSIEEIEIAHEQSLIGVAITGGCVSESRLRAAKPHHVIHSLHELKPILQERRFVA